MMAAQRFKGLGWFAAVVIVSLGFYLVSLQVAAERGRLESVDQAIVQAHRDIRSLETEFDTRANLAQLETWNGTVLALSAPTAAQFVASEAAFAQLNTLGRAPRLETAALLVPSGPPPAPTPAEATTPTPAPAPAPVETAAVAPPAKVAPVARATPTAVALQAAAITRAAAPARTVPVHARAEGVALLDRKLLSDSTLGELMSRARIETGSAR